MKKILAITITLLMLLCLCSCKSSEGLTELPPPEIDVNSQFGVDKNINMTTIDNYLGRDDVVYRDVRMLFDPADYGAIGGEADLTRTIQGFKVVPYPYIGTLSALPVEGAYSDNTLFDVVWNSDGSVISAQANYVESMTILEELFPKDKAIFIMCGGGGYAGMMKNLLIYLGWDETQIYNIGANWTYTGNNKQELIIYPEDANGDIIYATWRADYAYIEFERLHVLEK